MSYGNSINEAFVDYIRKADAARQQRVDAIKTRDQAVAYTSDVRKKILSIFNLPQERTPLNPVITGEHHYNGYSVENLYFYSRPDYPVTANFYKPDNISGKIPGVLFLCGHSYIGKAEGLYRICCINLAKKGIAVLSIDPVDQGERHQYEDVKMPYNLLCANHNLMGKQLALIDEWFGTWRVWDAVRAMDYLETRPEIDPSKLGVTGNSGGGTLTTWFTAVDPRPIAVAPNCYITSWKHNIENELPADIEQMPPKALELGLEMGDFLLSFAPRHTLILDEKNDFFDPRGTQETYEEVKRINALAGAETEILIGPTDHGYFKESRLAMYSFMTRHLLGKDLPEELDTNLPPVEETYAIGGALKNLPGQKYLREIAAESAKKIIAERKELSLDETKASLKQALAIQEPQIPYFRVLRSMPSKFCSEWRYSRFALETIPDRISAILMRQVSDNHECFHIDDTDKDVVLYIPDQDAASELDRRYDKRIYEANAADNETVYGLDIRTIGEMMPSGTDQPYARDYYAPYQFDYHYAALSFMTGRPILGGKVYDILCAIRLLAANGAKSITLEAAGQGVLPAIIAALLSDAKLADIRLNGGLNSFQQEMFNTFTYLPLSNIIPGVLKFTDVPQMKKLLKLK